MGAIPPVVYGNVRNGSEVFYKLIKSDEPPWLVSIRLERVVAR